MSRELTIRDSDGALVYDLLSGSAAFFGGGIRVNTASIVLNPLEAGLWEMTYSMFGGSGGDADTYNRSISEIIDPLVYQINRYATKQGSTEQSWIHEKNEGETIGTSPDRRAILISASFQPTNENSVGALMINNGFVGLLRLTRMDWEDKTTQDTAVYDLEVQDSGTSITNASVITQHQHTFDGSLIARIRSAELSLDFVVMYKTVLGIRPLNKDITNYQPVVNMGAGLLDADGDPIGAGGATDDFEMIPYQATGYTWPASQANPTYVGYYHNTYYAQTFTKYIRLGEITTQTTDTFNDDYVGEYEVFIRAFLTGTVSAPNTYFKFTLGYGDTSDRFISNDPVYQTRDTLVAENLFSLGNIRIPSSAFVVGLGGDYLQNFTISLTTEIISTLPDIAERIAVDSVFIMPSSNIVIENESVTPNTVGDLMMTYAESPMGNSGILLNAPYNAIEATGSIEAEPTASSIVILRSWYGNPVSSSASLQVRTYPKYLTSKS